MAATEKDNRRKSTAATASQIHQQRSKRRQTWTLAEASPSATSETLQIQQAVNAATNRRWSSKPNTASSTQQADKSVGVGGFRALSSNIQILPKPHFKLL